MRCVSLRLACAFALSLGLSAKVRADAGAALTSARASVQKLEASRTQGEAQLKALSAQIERAKAEPPSLTRDRKLQDALASSQTIANQLDAIAPALRSAHEKERGAENALVHAIDQLFARTPSQLSDDERIEYSRLRAQLTQALAEPVTVTTLANVETSPLDGPRELQQKADALRDSEDKLRREVGRIAARVHDVEKRRALREHAAAVDDDLFGENTSNRRVARLSTSTTGAATQATGTTPAAAPSGNSSAGPTTPVTSAGDTSTVGAPTGSRDAAALHNVLDPSTFVELERADQNGDIDQQTHALKRAQAELETMANELHKRADALSHRADAIKNQK